MDQQVPAFKRNRSAAEEVIEAEVVDVTLQGSTEIPEGSALAVVDAEETSMAATQASFSDKPNLRPQDIRIPMLRLAQGQTQEVLSREAQTGQFVLMGHDAVDEVELVILKMARINELRVGQGDDSKLLCRAADGENGVGTPGGACRNCSKMQWVDGAGPNGRNKPPECTEVFAYQAYSVTHRELVLIQFKRTSADEAKKINTMIASRGIGKFKITMKGTKQEKGRNVFYVPQVSPRPITPELWEEAQMFLF